MKETAVYNLGSIYTTLFTYVCTHTIFIHETKAKLPWYFPKRLPLVIMTTPTYSSLHIALLLVTVQHAASIQIYGIYMYTHLRTHMYAHKHAHVIDIESKKHAFRLRHMYM